MSTEIEKKPIKKRLDVLLFERGLCPSREKARSIIMSGECFVNGQRGEKAGELVKTDSQIEIKTQKLKYVSRGGFKLEKAINDFSVNVNGKVCADIGASTGGFTDCFLQNGAKKVYAIDVGYGQLDWSLRQNSNVVCMEKTNARYLTKEQLGDCCDFVSCDVSFISLTKILPIFVGEQGILKENGEALCLIKPQFECGKKYVGKKGVVADIFVHEYCIEKVINFAKEQSLYCHNLTYSPIKGPNGNIEYLIYLKKIISDFEPNVKRIVEESHKRLSENL